MNDYSDESRAAERVKILLKCAKSELAERNTQDNKSDYFDRAVAIIKKSLSDYRWYNCVCECADILIRFGNREEWEACLAGLKTYVLTKEEKSIDLWDAKKLLKLQLQANVPLADIKDILRCIKCDHLARLLELLAEISNKYPDDIEVKTMLLKICPREVERPWRTYSKFNDDKVIQAQKLVSYDIGLKRIYAESLLLGYEEPVWFKHAELLAFVDRDVFLKMTQMFLDTYGGANQ
jgi:hypothetical protein